MRQNKMDEQDKICIEGSSNHITDYRSKETSMLTEVDAVPGAATTCTTASEMSVMLNEDDTSSNVCTKATTVVTEGNRLRQLRKGLERTVDKCVSAGRYSLFMSHLPALGEKNPRALKAIQSQYLQKLKESIQCEIETMFKEENMAALMDELDQIIENTPETGVGAWRPSADVKENLRPHVMCVKEKQRKRLQDTLVALESETKPLQDLLSRKRQKLQNTVKVCKANVDKQVTEG